MRDEGMKMTMKLSHLEIIMMFLPEFWQTSSTKTRDDETRSRPETGWRRGRSVCFSYHKFIHCTEHTLSSPLKTRCTSLWPESCLEPTSRSSLPSSQNTCWKYLPVKEWSILLRRDNNHEVKEQESLFSNRSLVGFLLILILHEWKKESACETGINLCQHLILNMISIPIQEERIIPVDVRFVIKNCSAWSLIITLNS